MKIYRIDQYTVELTWAEVSETAQLYIRGRKDETSGPGYWGSRIRKDNDTISASAEGAWANFIARCERDVESAAARLKDEQGRLELARQRANGASS